MIVTLPVKKFMLYFATILHIKRHLPAEAPTEMQQKHESQILLFLKAIHDKDFKTAETIRHAIYKDESYNYPECMQLSRIIHLSHEFEKGYDTKYIRALLKSNWKLLIACLIKSEFLGTKEQLANPVPDEKWEWLSKLDNLLRLAISENSPLILGELIRSKVHPNWSHVLYACHMGFLDIIHGINVMMASIGIPFSAHQILEAKNIAEQHGYSDIIEYFKVLQINSEDSFEFDQEDHDSSETDAELDQENIAPEPPPHPMKQQMLSFFNELFQLLNHSSKHASKKYSKLVALKLSIENDSPDAMENVFQFFQCSLSLSQANLAIRTLLNSKEYETLRHELFTQKKAAIPNPLPSTSTLDGYDPRIFSINIKKMVRAITLQNTSPSLPALASLHI